MIGIGFGTTMRLRPKFGVHSWRVEDIESNELVRSAECPLDSSIEEKKKEEKQKYAIKILN